MENNFKTQFTRRDFIKFAAGVAGVLMVPSLSGVDRALAIDYSSDMPKLPDKLEQNIYYTAHIQKYGWTEWYSDGSLCGSTEDKRAIEAIAVILKEGIASYEVYLQGLSWTDWYGCGDVCGFINGENPCGAFKVRVPQGNVMYRAHFDDTGWTEWHKSGKICGIPGKYRILNAIEMKFV